MRVYAFRGLRYAPAATDPGAHAAPPFDQISDALRDRLHAADPHHFSRLTRPVAPAGGDPHLHAADLHRHWRRAGLLAADPAPALYPYEIRLASGARRLGLAARVGIEPLDAGVIRPHEATVTKTVSERLRLLEATRADLEPILLLCDDGGRLDELLRQDVATLEPVADHTDAARDRHILYRLDDPLRIRIYRELLAPIPAVIADGHHRYRVSQLYAERLAAAPGSPAACKLAVVTSLASPALTIDPIHRGLTPAAAAGLDPARLAPWVRGSARWSGGAGGALAQAVATAPQPALAVRWAGEAAEILHLDPSRPPRDATPAAAHLPVVLLHRRLFPALGLPDGAATDGTLVYRSDPDELWRQTESGELAAGVWLPPMGGEAFGAAVAGGELLPPKSTRFLPKLISGLVWAAHEED